MAIQLLFVIRKPIDVAEGSTNALIHFILATSTTKVFKVLEC
jgi:hypothetical protein